MAYPSHDEGARGDDDAEARGFEGKGARCGIGSMRTIQKA